MQISFFADFALVAKENLAIKMGARQRDGAQSGKSQNTHSNANSHSNADSQGATSVNLGDKGVFASENSNDNSHNVSANSNAATNSSDENAKFSLLDDINALNFADKTQAEKNSQEKSELDELLEIFYERLEQLKQELSEINAKINETADNELRLELMSQAQGILTEIQNIMAQIIKLLLEAMLTQSKQQRLDKQA